MACQSKNLTVYTQYSNKYLRLAYLDQQLVAYQKNINIQQAGLSNKLSLFTNCGFPSILQIKPLLFLAFQTKIHREPVEPSSQCGR
jgi:hypothetical protein